MVFWVGGLDDLVRSRTVFDKAETKVLSPFEPLNGRLAGPRSRRGVYVPNEGTTMITALVQFKLPHPVTREEAQEIFLGTAARFRETPGLLRKYCVLSQDGATAGGVYLWKSRQHAEGLYTKEWENYIRERYGAPPSVTYFESPVVIDNLTNEIVSDS